jgi:hypothetical protein
VRGEGVEIILGGDAGRVHAMRPEGLCDSARAGARPQVRLGPRAANRAARRRDSSGATGVALPPELGQSRAPMWTT